MPSAQQELQGDELCFFFVMFFCCFLCFTAAKAPCSIENIKKSFFAIAETFLLKLLNHTERSLKRLTE